MKNIQCGGFLVSRNQYLDYRTIAAPSFICKAGVSKLLAEVAEGELTEQSCAFYREIHGSKVGDFTLIYQVLEATSNQIGLPDDEILKDHFGREIYFIGGFVFQGLFSDSNTIKVTQKEIDLIYEELKKCYQEFWNCMTPQPAIPLGVFTMPIETTIEEKLKLIPVKTYALNTQNSISIYEKTDSKNIHKNISFPTERFDDEIDSLVVGQDKSYIAIRYGQTILIKNWAEGKTTVLNQGRKLFGGYSSPIAISNNSQFIATAIIESGDLNVIKLWDVKTQNQIVKSLGEHEIGGLSRVKAIAFTPDNKLVASGGGDKKIMLWDVKTEGIELGTFLGHTSEVRSIVISPDGLTLASGDGHGYVRLWNLRSQKNTYTEKIYRKPVNSLAFSPDSKFLVCGSDECDVTLIDGKIGKKIATFGEHLSSVNSVCFSPNGKFIASASDDCKIKVWDINSKKEIIELSGHTRGVTSVVFYQDNQTLVSGSKDCTIRFWHWE